MTGAHVAAPSAMFLKYIVSFPSLSIRPIQLSEMRRCLMSERPRETVMTVRAREGGNKPHDWKSAVVIEPPSDVPRMTIQAAQSVSQSQAHLSRLRDSLPGCTANTIALPCSLFANCTLYSIFAVLLCKYAGYFPYSPGLSLYTKSSNLEGPPNVAANEVKLIIRAEGEREGRRREVRRKCPRWFAPIWDSKPSAVSTSEGEIGTAALFRRTCPVRVVSLSKQGKGARGAHVDWETKCRDLAGCLPDRIALHQIKFDDTYVRFRVRLAGLRDRLFYPVRASR